MALSVPAGVAEDVAAGFRRFRDPLPEHATVITGLVADLFTISSSLKTLDDLSQNRRYRNIFPLARSDIELVSASLQYTLDDIVDFFSHLDRRGSSRGAHKKTWSSMCVFFMEESDESLAIRLVKYKSFLRELEDLIKDAGPDHGHMSHLREAFKELLVQQDSRLAMRLGAMSVSSPSSLSSNSTAPSSPVSDRKPRTRRSYERPRPPLRSPQTPTSPSSGSFFDIPPLAPDAPGSPVTSSATSHSLGSNTFSDHWATRVFLGPRTSTRFRQGGEDSKCYGDIQTGLNHWLHKEGYEELLHLAFPGFAGSPDFQVMFYLREDDHRARIVCKASTRTGPDESYCLPLNLLEVIRRDPSCLHLCRRRHGGTELVIWAILRFRAIEDMVVFFCTFLALRSQDSGRPVTQIRDYELPQEVELFGSPIMDDGFVHALRVYRDKVTGAVRLQASVHKGEMKRAPIWTAFITDQIRTRGWIRVVEQKVVLLSELRQTIFTFPEYTPPKTTRGGHLLKFTSRTDAESFINTMAELANEGNLIY
ncbi:hypothetical protein BDW59DRAFT_32425 [Aspergillus cavernicola]|uniref:Fungal-type protein kinase domain-containing protein n=1 Tax=Aspergillus cavernicola TaxID=176166 RepID=A0ABR4IS89_9EURO